MNQAQPYQTMLEDLRTVLAELACAADLWRPEAFAARAEALDRLELATLGLEDTCADTVERTGSPQPGWPVLCGQPISRDGATLLHQAAAVTRRLAEANRALCDALRAAIRRGACRGSEARRLFEHLAGSDNPPLVRTEGEYDLLDSLVSELLLDTKAPDATLPPAKERVAYQPTPARVVMELLDRVALGPADVFYDLGAGLGHVCLLVYLLSGARARGIEIEPAYCRYARRQARDLRLAGVEFAEGDVRETSLAGGACYFLYTPFTGQTLTEALSKLAGEARARSITVAAYGPCTVAVARQPWLAQQPWPKSLAGQGESGLAIFHSRRVPNAY
jgi:hypothetical protein